MLLILEIYFPLIDISSLNPDFLFKEFYQNIIFLIPFSLMVIFFRGILESKLFFKITSTNRALLNSLILAGPLISDFVGLRFEDTFIILFFGHLLSVLVMGFFAKNIFFYQYLKI